MKFILAFLLCLPLALAGCQDNPVKTPKGTYYELDGYVTAADAAALNYSAYQDCGATGGQLPCSKRNIREQLANASKTLGTAMDSYSQTVRDPNFTQGGLQAADVAVRNALKALNKILLDLGLATAATGVNL